MSALQAVLYDLWIFSVRYHFGLSSTEESQPKMLPPAEQKTARATVGGSVVASSTARQTVVSDALADAAVVYSATKAAALQVLPTKTFDGTLMMVPYGQSCKVQSKQGQWLKVVVGDSTGWIHKDEVSDSLSKLQPQLQPGEQYDADHSATVAIRAYLHDSFHVGDLALPLQDVEYVTYMLQRKNRFIAWPKERPRIAGTWQRLLRGVIGVHLSIHPKTESVMEYVNEDNTGHVAFVESVFPDGSIALSEVGYPTEGVYTTRTLNKDECKELRPIFIEVA